MDFFYGNPDLMFKWFDLALGVGIYGLSVVLFLRHTKDYMAPILFLGLIIFPLQFSIWFLQRKFNFTFPSQINILEIFYLLFIKVCILMTLLLSRRY